MTRKANPSSTTARRAPQPPAILRLPEARAQFERLIAEYNIRDEAGILLCTQIGECLQDLRYYEGIIKKEGALVVDQRGGLKANPVAALARDSRKGLLVALRQLGCDIEQPKKQRHP